MQSAETQCSSFAAKWKTWGDTLLKHKMHKPFVLEEVDFHITYKFIH